MAISLACRLPLATGSPAQGGICRAFNYGETCKLTSNYDDTIDLLCASYRLAKGTVSRDWIGLQVIMLEQSMRITEKEPVLVFKIIAGFMDLYLHMKFPEDL